MRAGEQMIRVGVVGLGAVGQKRVASALNDPRSRLTWVADIDEALATAVAARSGCRYTADWRDLIAADDVDAVAVATYHKWLSPIAAAALRSGKHVLCEKPCGRGLSETQAIESAARDTGLVAKAGFTLRFHPAIVSAHQIHTSASLGRPLLLRAVYGHGGRMGYDREWRADGELAGGGELLDQGIHLIDLARWFLGDIETASGLATRLYWDGGLEDNAFVLATMAGDAIASLHASWTEWKNKFCLELFTAEGFIRVDGLGGSYGEEKLTVGRRLALGSAPDEKVESFPEPDVCWTDDWSDFLDSIESKRPPKASICDAVEAMRAIDCVYRGQKRFQ